MKITTYASAAAIAFAMSMGTLSAEDQFSVMKDMPVSAPAEEQISIMKDVPSAIPMAVEQLGETVGADEHMDHENGHFRRRWFHRRNHGPCCNGDG